MSCEAFAFSAWPMLKASVYTSCMDYSLRYIWESAGGFVYPLLLCSVLACVVFIERFFALKAEKVMPKALLELFLKGNLEKTHLQEALSAGGRILEFFHTHHPSPAALKAYADLEISRLQRGFFILEIVISAAPLIGLLGTVMGLVHLFSKLPAGGELPSPDVFIQGIALALTTTMLGLCIAIPCIAGYHFLVRRVEVLASAMVVGVERLISLSGIDA